MKLAIQHHLVPGESLAERFQRAAEYGFDGVELTAWGLPRPFAEEREAIEAAMKASGLPVASLCTSGNDDFVHPDPQERARRFDKLVALLRFADTVGAAGLIGLPIRQPLAMPDLSPWADARTVTTELTTRLLADALKQTPGTAARIFLEPLNRYEAKYLNTVGHAADLCRAVGDARVRVMADLFHMSIEEADPAASLAQAVDHVGHVHLADSNRHLPGHGHTDFVAPFRSLARGGFSGWFALECAVTGDPHETIPACVRRLRGAWRRAEDTAHARPASA
jgi:sugar phosphate isomerase/epimerase